MTAFGINFADLFSNLGSGITGGFTSAVDELSGDIIKPIESGFENVTSQIKDFGLDVVHNIENVAEGIAGDIGAGFQYIEATGSFFANLTLDTFEFLKNLLMQIIKLLPYIRDLLKASIVLAEYGFATSVILLALAPALIILYYTVYLIQIFENKY